MDKKIKINAAKIVMFGCRYDMSFEELANYLSVTTADLEKNIFLQKDVDLDFVKMVAQKMDY